MNKGDFNNLSGAGKPLKNLQSQNPYTDFTTEKMNKILIDNGFVPAWILLQKEIRDDTESLKESLRQERAKFHFPLEPNEAHWWKKIVENSLESGKAINKKIDNFNLIVPLLTKQMVHIQAEKIAEKILNEEPTDRPAPEPIPESKAPSDYNKPNLFSFFDSILK
jgi:DnaJ homolog subfamily C member 28